MSGPVSRQHELAKLIADTTKAQNTDFLTTDFQMKWSGSLCRISVQISSNVTLSLVPSSGTAIVLNGGTALAASGLYTFEVALDQGRTWNLQTSNAAGTTVHHLVVQEWGIGQ